MSNSEDLSKSIQKFDPVGSKNNMVDEEYMQTLNVNAKVNKLFVLNYNETKLTMMSSCKYDSTSHSKVGIMANLGFQCA